MEKIDTELDVINKLLGCVNGKEEYEWLLSEKYRIERRSEDKMETAQSSQPVLRSPAQEALVAKIMQSRWFNDSEYKFLRGIWMNQAVTMKDASVFIEYLVSAVALRGHFISKKHRSFKRCKFCNVRDDIVRLEDSISHKRFWACETCYLNSARGSCFPVPRRKDNGN